MCRVLLLVLLGCMLIGPAAAIPGELTISGQLLDANGQPVVFTETRDVLGHPQQVVVTKQLASRLRFYDTSTTTTVIESLETTATTTNGYFTIRFQPDPRLLGRDAVFYELGIDVGQDGLDAGDFFADRFQMSSVPFALSGRPTPFQSILSGRESILVYLKVSQSAQLSVVPFNTPAGGVRFNRFNLVIGEAYPNTSFSVAIYDDAGNRVVTSPVVETHNTAASGFLEITCPLTDLAPSSLYFSAFSASGTGNPDDSSGDPMIITFPQVSAPAIPLTGYIDSVVSNGVGPEHFDLAQITASYRHHVPPLALSYVAPTQAQRAPLRGGPQPDVRWVPTPTVEAPIQYSR